jgi:anti-sigma-K factor RskA
MNVHDEVDELLAAFAMDAVTADEATLVRAHLRDCEDCRQTLVRLRNVASTLSLAVDEVAPPPSLRARILAQAAEGRPGSSHVPEPPSDPEEKILQLRERRHLPRWMPAAAAAVLVAGLGAWNLKLQDQLAHTRQPVSPPAAQQAVLKGTLKGPHDALMGSITYLSQDKVALVALQQMSAPPDGRTYELWIIGQDGVPLPSGVFRPEGDGSKLLVVTRDIKGSTLAVTEEPVGGSSRPTSLPFITGRV